ncbi:MAG: LysR family transcriptional regulator [Candidatus Omnitrophota bacterium]|nr:MAG: LysR family transcriptional regulator [Candidatus Omnitrophota bacterium]
MKIAIKSKIWFEKDNKNVFGKGKYLILKAIDETGSLNKAAKRMNISYRRAWSYITGAEKRLGKALITKVKGGKHGGGAILTEYAKDLIGKFNVLEKEINVFTEKTFKDVFFRGSQEKT